MGPTNATFETIGAIYVGIIIVVACIALGMYVTGTTLRGGIFKVLTFLAKKKLITAPKKKLYAVELHVMLDGIVIKKLPVEVMAPGRRAAKFEIGKRLTFKTATTATVAHLRKHS